ncbi:putative thioredoxin reductase [Talaromyces proteolyticus]|uniref:Thioredoxin reductase n=1 Tax=Talaromyces proteolyticus TaxID=1131652 RepID=A0AAD4L0P3_9EURO|nr:putative thioredoxin reductase [Talaromyces proteolyticus]KAH8703350.1 putative thioredoxin reductase [Talaromyces proteolyticus]
MPSLKVLALFSLTLLSQALATTIPETDYDAIVIGGGPAGLSATSGLSRVRRRTLMLDSGVYRNDPTRHMHDVIGNDGTVPAVFRYLARQQISRYNATTTMKNATVISVESINNGSYYKATDSEGLEYTARRIVLATGMKDILPDTPGVKEGWGKGIYWCPWCDGYEHRDQAFGILGNLSDAMGSVIEVWQLNEDIIAFVNGTNTPEQQQALAVKYPNWQAQLEAYNVSINNETIVSIDRLQDGSTDNDPAEDREFDLFRVNLADGSSIERGAFITNFPDAQYSNIPQELDLQMNGTKIAVSTNMKSNDTGVYAIGDINNDGATNVPHAMFSGKRAAVYIHVELGRQESLAAIGKRELSDKEREKEARRLVGSDLDELWKRVQEMKK